ncbi:DUF6176 family protein [Natronorarus salvus]|uniref:DUF6176 family protein n=1 Tax=Natronorarus salvus TaxID=3117733 RepID=UPI002F264E33
MEVVLLRLTVRRGLPRLVAELFVRVFLAEQAIMRRGGALGRGLRGLLNESVESVLREEGMYTESAFLDRSGDRLSVLWYMEAEDVGYVYEAFIDSDHAATRGERFLQWLFEEPDRILSTDVESEYPLLLHAWNRERP